MGELESNFPQLLPSTSLISIMDNIDSLSYESLIPLMEQMEILLPVRYIILPPNL